MNYTMVDGFALVAKCTAEGRALMSMDYQQIIHRVEIITQQKVNPKQRHFAEDYIRAYYLSEQELEKVHTFSIEKNFKKNNKKLSSVFVMSAIATVATVCGGPLQYFNAEA